MSSSPLSCHFCDELVDSVHGIDEDMEISIVFVAQILISKRQVFDFVVAESTFV